jgi:type IV secretion system protein VirB10
MAIVPWVKRDGEGSVMKITRMLPFLLALVFSISMGWTEPAQEMDPSGEPAVENWPEEVIVPEGTVIPIVLTAYLNTRNSQVGDIAYADTVYPVWVQQRLVIPKGSTIRGTVTEVVRPGRIRGKGRMAIRFDDILLPNGVRRDLIASFRGIHGPEDEKLDRESETVAAGGSEGSDAGTVVGMGSQGAIIGAIAGRGSGAAIGAGVGAAAGIATVLFTRGRDLVLSPGTQFDLELKRPLRFAFIELEFTADDLNRARSRKIQSEPPSSNTRIPAMGGRRTWPFPGIGIPRWLF